MTKSQQVLRPFTRDGTPINALAFVNEMTEFKMPGQNREQITLRLATALWRQIPLASVSTEKLGVGCVREDYLRYAAWSQQAIAGCTNSFQDFLLAVMKAGIRVQCLEVGDVYEIAINEMMGKLTAFVPVPCQYSIAPMSVESLAKATAEQIRRHYVNAAWETVQWTAGKFVEAMETLFQLMAVGLVEFLGADTARIYYCRGVLKRFARKAGLSSPDRFATHPLLEDPDKVVARLFEMVNVRPTDFSSWRAKTPRRVTTLLGAIPDWFRGEISGFSGKMVREGYGLINPTDRSHTARDQPSFQTFSWLVFAGQFVLGAWDEAECPSLLRQLFGIQF